MIMENELTRLNNLRSDFIKYADSNEPSVWELDINEIGGSLPGYTYEDEPVILLDCVKTEGRWYICVNRTEDEVGCCPLEDLTENQIYEIRRLVESWLANKDTNRWKNDAIISFLRGV